ncbi:TRAP transporter large permease [Roseovarius sp. MMSF_3281]|uniref:TRAP transporter large permease n=1 Tax=Roseovarius sp. MMSF_3281 TaxID=3046694 RepID=UPI00273E9A2E|nr:TRAP transporter large permease [Roseovarius sp. MMSF_3281]
MALTILVLVLFLLLIIGLPLPYSLGTAALAGLLAMGEGIPLAVVPQRFVAGINNFSFMAIPFFLLLGDLMNAAGITRRIIRLSNALVGHMPGGLAQVNVVSSMFFGGISGSATADTASIGSILIPSMKKEGYEGSFSAALTAASSTAGPIIPPSILLVLYGVIAGVSITDLFLAGYVPGVMLGLGLLAVSYVISKRRGYPVHSRASFTEILVALKESAWAVFMPFLIIGGMLTGVFTVTEAAGVSVIYGLVVGIVIYGDLKIRDLPGVLAHAMIKIGTLMTVAAAALIFAWVLTIMQVPQAMAEAIFVVTENPLLILLMLNILFLAVGMFMEAKAAMLILLPVILPLLPQVGIDPVHFGVVIVFNLLIGLVTPPVGLCLNLAAKIAGVRIDKAAQASMPMLALMLLVLVVITYVPGVVLWLPEYLN